MPHLKNHKFMPRFSNILFASLVVFAAGGIAYWQIVVSNDDSAAVPSHSDKNTLTHRAPRVAPESIYRKITDPSVRWEVRVDMLRRMEADKLKSQDIDTLFALLRYQPEAGQEQNWWVVVNEIMEQMRIQAIGSERYGKEMLAIIRDPASPEILRDYAVQHLGQWVSPRGEQIGQPSEQNPDIIRQTAETLAMLVMDPETAHTSISGTSLMVLIDMKGGGVAEEIINPVIESLQPWLAAALTDSNNTSKITRISAINAIGMLQLKAFAPDIRNLATDQSADPSLRLNSVATLGQIGEASDIETLKTIAETDTRLQYAAQAALQKLADKHL